MYIKILFILIFSAEIYVIYIRIQKHKNAKKKTILILSNLYTVYLIIIWNISYNNKYVKMQAEIYRHWGNIKELKADTLIMSQFAHNKNIYIQFIPICGFGL